MPTPQNPGAGPGKIVSPNPPLVIQIQVSDTGQATMVQTRDVPFHSLVAIFSQVLIGVCAEIQNASQGQPSAKVMPVANAGLILPRG